MRAAAHYFAWVFGAGIALGLIRVPLLVPRLGTRLAELVEMPVMLLVIYLAAKRVVRRMPATATRRARLSAGLLALATLLIVEFTVVRWLQGQSLQQALADRDPVSGAAYALSLVVFALMPALLKRDA
jgi:hypothetical protein